MDTRDWSAEELKKYGAAALEWAAHYLENIREFPVMPAVRPGELADRIPPHAPVEGEPMEAILGDFVHTVLPAVNHWNHPMFH